MRFQSSLLALISLALFANSLPYESEDAEQFADADQIAVFPFLNDATDISADAASFEDWKQQVLREHNAYRSQYGASALTWSDALYPGTEQWAKQCQFRHSGGHYGENLAAGTGNAYGFSNGLKSWMDEAAKYNYAQPGFSSATGHFTQVVWKGSHQVACAIADCRAGTIFGQPSKNIVCRYSPQGNIIGQFAENVGRKK